MEWETGSATLPGSEMLSLLMTAPQVGKLTAITWLVHIITPEDFLIQSACCLLRTRSESQGQRETCDQHMQTRRQQTIA